MAREQFKVGVIAAMNRNAYARLEEMVEGAGHAIFTTPSFSPTKPNERLPDEEIASVVGESDVVFTSGSQNAITENTLSPAPARLRGIVTSSLGYNSIDVAACTRNGIIVGNSPVDTNFEGVFQHTVLLILALKRRLAFFQDWARSGGRATPNHLDGLPHLLDADTTLGIVGLGRIGYRVARMFKLMFGTNVVAYDPFVAEDRAQEIGVTLLDDLNDLLRTADIVSIHCFLSTETRHLIGERELRQLKPTAVIINTSRGPVIDEVALITALNEGWLAGAGLDVTEQEPVAVDNPLLAMDNVIVTPHIAGVSAVHMIRGTEFAATGALRMLSGRVPRIVVNPEVIPSWSDRFDLSGIRYGGTVYTSIR